MDISLYPELISKFKQWYDAVWLGDEGHGQTIPQSFSDARYAEYMDGYTLALGAWIESARQTANLNLLEAGLLSAIGAGGVEPLRPSRQLATKAKLNVK